MPWMERAKSMRVLITDDEPLAQSALASILEHRTDVDGFDVANDAVETLERLSKESYDVLLLDINMPEMSGIELVDLLRKQQRPVPSVVFVTAYHEHAITAFGRHAVDYVLKPFSQERIHEALDVAFRRSEGERAARLLEDLPHLQNLMQQPKARIAIKAQGRILFVAPADIHAVTAEGNYVVLQREDGSLLLREGISAMEEKLRPYGFIRIHRSVLINSAFVEEVRPLPTGEYRLRMNGGSEYTVTRSYKRNLRAMATAWIGADGFSEH
jgi:two-component system LytT family response regulator